MATPKKLSEFPALTTLANADLFPVVDVEGTTKTNKIITYANLITALDDTFIKKPTNPTEGFYLKYSQGNWVAAAAPAGGGGTSVTSLNLGGELSGTTAAGKVAKLFGKSLSTKTPAKEDFLKFDGTNWTPSAIADLGFDAGTFVKQSTNNDYWLFSHPAGLRIYMGRNTTALTGPITFSAASGTNTSTAIFVNFPKQIMYGIWVSGPGITYGATTTAAACQVTAAGGFANRNIVIIGR